MYLIPYKSIVFYISLCFFILCFNTNNLIAFPKHSSYALLDYNSGTLLDGKNENVPMQPASLTKLMTLYIVFEYLEENKIKLSTKLKVSKKAASMPPSKLWLKPGQTITVKNAINAMIIKSANDVAHTVAENLGHGSEATFINLMNQKAKELGLKNTHFQNANGLTSAGQQSTAYDLAILARSIMLNYSKYYYLFSQQSFKWHKYSYRSTNHLLKYSNIDGLKTGYTFAAGFNMVVSSEINGVRVIVSSLGSKSSAERNTLVKQLVNSGIVIAQNFRFSNIAYKAPPEEVVAANNLMNNENSLKTAHLSSNEDSIDNNHSLQTNTRDHLDTNNSTITNIIAANTSSSSIIPVNYTTVNSAKNEINNNYSSNPPSTERNYFVQIGVFSSMKNAKKAANQALLIDPILKQANLTINVINKKEKGSALYRVRLNNLTSNDANSACLNLKSKNLSCFVSLN